jgi:DNA-binding winged helix-turn-helix (wHTH) protein
MVFRFRSYVLDAGRGALRRGLEPCPLQAQPAQLLALLVERAGEVVSRDEIQARLWPDVVVAYDQNINFAIRQVRIALGADAALVQTVPRRGYRFVGEVSRIDGEAVTRPRMRPRSLAVAAAMLVALASGFGAGIVMRDRPLGAFVYVHLVHPDRCPYLRAFLLIHPAS